MNPIGAQLSLTFRNVPLVFTTLTQEQTLLPFVTFGKTLLTSVLLTHQ